MTQNAATIAKGNKTLETIEKCLLKLSDLWVRILENIRKMKAAVCGGSMRRKWRMGNCEKGSERFCKNVLWILRIEANGTKEWKLGAEGKRGNMLACTL
jgi:hypothetical protein